MTLLEAIQNCGENWFRPVRISGWKGMAVAVKNECTVLAPDDLDTEVEFMVVDIDSLLGDWEIVTPEQVLSERGGK